MQFARFSPDGRRLVTVWSMGRVGLWDAATGQQIASLDTRQQPSYLDTLYPNFGPVSALVDFSPDGRKVATAFFEEKDYLAHIWDADTGKPLAVLHGHDNPILSIRFSPDGRRLATASLDATARIWDADSGAELRRIGSPLCSFAGAEFSPDGRFLLTAQTHTIEKVIRSDGGFGSQVNGRYPEQDCAARIWDASNGQELAALRWDRGTSGGVERAAFSADGNHIVTAGSPWGGGSTRGTPALPRLWQAGNWKEIATLPVLPIFAEGREPHLAAAFSPDGRWLVTVQDDKTARVWDVARGTEAAVLRGHNDTVRDAAFSPDGQRLATASADGTARLWPVPLDLSRGQWLGMYLPAFSPDGQRLATVSDRQPHVVAVRDSATGRELTRLQGHTQAVRHVAFSLDGQRLVTCADDHTARIWDAAAGKELRVLQGNPEGFLFAGFSPDGKLQVTTTRTEPGDAQVWDAASGKQLAVLAGDDKHSILSACFSPDGSRLLTRCYVPPRRAFNAAFDDAVACVWETATGKPLLRLQDADNHVQGGCSVATFSPNGRRILTGRDGNYFDAHLWDAETGKHLIQLGRSAGQGWVAEFSADGRRIVTAYSNLNQVRVWDAESGKELLTLTEPSGPVHSAGFSPDGSYLLTASETVARLRDAATGKEVATLQEPDYRIHAARFSPDGRWVLAEMAWGKEGTTPPALATSKVRLWPVDPLTAAKSRKPRELTVEERERFEIGAAEPGAAP
jgi:WD40 repeat protein